GDLVGGRLPAAALDTAKDSVGGGLAVAEQVAKNPSAGGPQQAPALVDAVHESFAHGVAQTSLIGGIIMVAGTLIVLAVLPGRRAGAKERPEEETGGTTEPAGSLDEVPTDSAR
ncbi:MFS transporter, partial [Streptomyces sp. NPDC001002]